MPSLLRFVRNDDAQDLIEYALIAAFLCLAAVIGAEKVGAGVSDAYASISIGMQRPSTDESPADGPRVTSEPSVTSVEPCESSGGVREDRCRSAAPGK